jgi:hypothetical protein
MIKLTLEGIIYQEYLYRIAVSSERVKKKQDT